MAGRRYGSEAAPLGGATPADPIGAILRGFEDRYQRNPEQFMGMAPPEQSYENEISPQDTGDPQSAIASIIQQMEAAARRGREPDQGYGMGPPLNQFNPEDYQEFRGMNKPIAPEDYIQFMLNRR